VAGRLLTAAGAAASVADILEAGADATPPARTAGDRPIVRAVVSGTHGDGLRLRDSPDGERLSAYPDGTVVTVECRVSGSSWSYVRTPDGSRGYMADAYLVLDADPGAVPPC
jgi:hypothetical protein